MLAEVIAEPLYEKVKRNLIKYMDDKKPALLPREKALMETFGVSRNTLRRAVFELTKDGVLKPVQGRGTMVVKYSGLISCDIGILISDSIKLTDPWIARNMESFRTAALAGGYNLNLFMCHDYSLAPSTNSVFRYLASSRRLAGLLMLSVLNEEEIIYIQRNNIQIVNSEFNYVNIPLPFVNFDFKYAMETIIERCIRRNIKRIACVAHRVRPRAVDPCIGMLDILMESLRSFAEEHQFPQYLIPVDSLIEEQLRNLYETEPETRPELLVVCNLKDRETVNNFFIEHTDWSPILINPYMDGEKVYSSGIVYNPGEIGLNAFKLFKRILSGDNSADQIILVKPELILKF